MRFNWGWGITLAIVIYMGFIASMVVRAFGTDTDLTSADYYVQELAYEQRIEARRNTAALTGAFALALQDAHLTVQLPEEWHASAIAGTVFLYRPDNAALDRQYSFTGPAAQVVIPSEALIPGQYIVRVLATHGDTPYFFEESWTQPAP